MAMLRLNFSSTAMDPVKISTEGAGREHQMFCPDIIHFSAASTSKPSRSSTDLPDSRRNGASFSTQEFQGNLHDTRNARMVRERSRQGLEDEVRSGFWDLGFFRAGGRSPSRDPRLFRVATGRKVAVNSDGNSTNARKEVGLPISIKRRNSKPGSHQALEEVQVGIEDSGNNSRTIVAKITIEAHLEDVWAILTDYEHLSDFFPGLAVNKLLEKRDNGARLYQVGEQNIAFGINFNAKAVVDCMEKPVEVHPNFIQRDIDFETIEGDFQIFRGIWRMQQEVRSSLASSIVGGGQEEEVMSLYPKTILSYHLVVQPKMWLPVAFVEGRVTSEVQRNLVCIRDMLQLS